MSRNPRRLLVLLLGVVLVVAAAVAAVLYVRQVQAVPGDDGGSAAPTTTPNVVTEPAPGDPVGTDEPQATTGGGVDVVVTYSGYDDDAQVLEVDGFVSGVVESGGTCQLDVTRAGRTVSVDHPAEPDASTTQCGALTIDRDQLGEGSWSAVLSYRSATSTGAADAVEVDVPRE
jgi:hypothetical protein